MHVDEDGFVDIREPYVEDDAASRSLDARLDSTTNPAEASPASFVAHDYFIRDTFARLRELERMEEQQELDDLDEQDDKKIYKDAGANIFAKS